MVEQFFKYSHLIFCFARTRMPKL